MRKKGTKMVLGRNAVLRHLSGQSVRFEKDVPIGVPPRLVKSAIGMGAEFVDGKTDLNDDEASGVNHGPDDPEDRLEEISEVISQMIAENDRDDWTGTGTPNVNRVGQRLGYKVQKNEVVQAFQMVTNSDTEEEAQGDD